MSNGQIIDRPLDINLANASDYLQFQPDNITLNSVNYMYGPNGSGKTTLRKYITRWLKAHQYTVLSFKGYDKILTPVEDKDSSNKEFAGITAITLGSFNSDIQEKITQKQKELTRLNLIKGTGDNETPGLDRELSDKKNQEFETKKQRGDYYTIKARKLDADECRPVKPRYNRTDLINELKETPNLNESLKSEEEMKKIRKTCRQERKDELKPLDKPSRDLEVFYKEAEDVLGESITQKLELPEIGSDSRKRVFAQTGLEIYRNTHNEKCAFCGNIIQDKRLIELEQVFDQSYIKRQHYIASLARSASEFISAYNNVKNESELLTDEKIYPSFLEKEYHFSQLKKDLCQLISNLQKYMGIIQDKLSEKEKDLLLRIKLTESIPPDQFGQLTNKVNSAIDQVNDFIRKNNDYGQRLERNMNNARIELHKELLKQIYQDETRKLLESNYKKAHEEYNNVEQKSREIENKISNLTQEIDDLTASMRDEKRATLNINENLQLIGDKSFSLKPYKEGLYRIYSKGSEVPRPIDGLSEGEKNIIAFLYFFQQIKREIKERETTQKEQKIAIIIDDPMNSNDSISQFLMASYINELSWQIRRSMPQGIMVIFSHNVNFFLNARPYEWKPKNERNANYHSDISIGIDCFKLNRDKSTTHIVKILDANQDVHTAYDQLWRDLKFAYNHNNAGLMWNDARRIISSYAKFNHKKSLYSLLSSDNNIKSSYISKILNVNSHEIVDTAIDVNAINPQNVLDIIKEYFKMIGEDEHCDKMWHLKS